MMSNYEYGVAAYHLNVAPEDSAMLARELSGVINALAGEGWTILQVNSETLANNVFRALVFTRKEVEPQQSAEPVAEAEPEDDTPAHGSKRRR